LLSPVTDADPPGELPDIMKTADVVDWILKWTGSELYPSQYGPPGWPGIDPELFGVYGYVGNNWGWPEMIPYPGSLEHVRNEMQRYLPMYPMYNARTLVRSFRATALPGIDHDRIVKHAEPVFHVPKYCSPDPDKDRFTDCIKLGKYNQPVDAVRFDQHHPPIEIDLGTLRTSAYVVRMIAATESEKVQQSTKRLVIHCEVNDGLNGEVSAYRKRCAANDEFYSVAELFFMAPAERQYKVKLWVDASSQLPLYVYSIDVHDRLAQLANRAGKRTASFYDEQARTAKWADAKTQQADSRSKQVRFDADAALWKQLPAMNSQPCAGTINWDTVVGSVFRLPQDKEDDGMGIDLYGSDMIWNIPEKEYAGHRYEGWYRVASEIGRYWRLQRQTYYEKAKEIEARMRRVRQSVREHAERYDQTGNEVVARTAAVHLAMAAWMNMFGMDETRQTMWVIDCIPEIGWNLVDKAFRRRDFRPCTGAFEQVREYDKVFPHIRKNADLAESLGRFIPWIKTPEDMQRFYDVGLLQLPAHETMIYNRYNDFSSGEWMSWYIATQQDIDVVTSWIKWICRYVWVYPHMPMGVDETMFQGWTRDGTTTIGSTFYAYGSGGVLRDIKRNLEPFEKDPIKGMEFSVDIPEIRSRIEAGCRFPQDVMVAGGYRFWIGDVSGPSRPRWHGSGDPRLDGKTDPKNKSRVLSTWFGVLETAVEEDDCRKRRAAGLRVGYGYGHGHTDPLDLQIWALGVPLCGDWGARAGYDTPPADALMSHNTLVAPALLKSCNHSWVTSMADTEGSRYLMGRVRCPGFYGRQLALIDLDDAAANSYVVDVFRVKGAAEERPYYAFHGPPPDEFYTNIEKVEAGYPGGMQEPLFDPEHNWHGQIPVHFTATWRMNRDGGEIAWKPSPKIGKRLQWMEILVNNEGKVKMTVPGAEKMAMGGEFGQAEPRKHIRAHLVGQEGAEAFGSRAFGMRGEVFVNDMLFVYPAEWKGEAVFPVVYEPFPDETIVQNVRLLSGRGSTADAFAGITMEISLRGKRQDVVYAAPRDSKAGDIPGYGTAQGEYAFLSYDEGGLRQATLVGGVLLDARDIRIRTAKAAYEGTVVSGNASQKMLEFSDGLPKEAEGAVIEIGPEVRRTSYTIKSIDGNRVVMDKDFALGMSRIRGFLEDGSPFTNDKIDTPGSIKEALAAAWDPNFKLELKTAKGVPVSNEKGEVWWTVGEPYPVKPDELGWWLGGTAHPSEIPPRAKALRLENGPEPRSVLRAGERLWVHEVGVGNSYRLPVYVNVIRRKDGRYDVQSNAKAEITVAGKPLSSAAGDERAVEGKQP
jgi:hypothetical protein